MAVQGYTCQYIVLNAFLIHFNNPTEGKWWLTIEKNHSCKWRTKAGLNRSLDARHTWSIVSKAALRSRNTSKVPCCSFTFISISFHTCSRAVSLSWNFQYAYWNSEYSWKEDMGWDNCWSTTFSVTLETDVRFTDCAIVLFSWPH